MLPVNMLLLTGVCKFMMPINMLHQKVPIYDWC